MVPFIHPSSLYIVTIWWCPYLLLFLRAYSFHLFINLFFSSEEAELQCVPGQFDSVEEYVRVFEPLLFEECRAQLYSTWEELTETGSRDSHIMVRVKSVERRERGTLPFIGLKVIYFLLCLLIQNKIWPFLFSFWMSWNPCLFWKVHGEYFVIFTLLVLSWMSMHIWGWK